MGGLIDRYEVSHRKKLADREERDKARLKHTFKKEMKGAIREIRKDASFIANVSLSEQMARDQARRAKIKSLFQGLELEQHDANMERKERAKKRRV